MLFLKRKKDAGDDADVTDGMLVWASVRRTGAPGVCIDGGEGVGRVTKPCLDQPVGAAAINRVPRRMIAEAVQAELDAAFDLGWYLRHVDAIYARFGL